MKATLEFTLPEDSEEHLRAVLSTDLALALWEITYNLHKRAEGEFEQRVADSNPNKPYHFYDVIDFYKEQIHDILRDNGLDLDKLVS